MDTRGTLHEALQQRVYGGITPQIVFKRARGSKYLIQCLKKTGSLTGHEGCVNTIAWSDCGELLLSGSDDCKLNIYRPREHKLLHSIRSGHRANVFSAKFLPCTSNKWVVSCAGDGMVHFTDLDRPERLGLCSFNCHVGTTYEVITTPGDPNTFLTCGEDGTVRMFDLRTKTKCSSRDCKEDVLIDSGKAVTSISINPLAPYQLSIGCENSSVGVFDRRSLSIANHSSGTNGMRGLVCKFRPDALLDRTCRVTSLNFSEDGGELLVSYCADYLYLYNMRGEKHHRLAPGSNGENGFNPSTPRNNAPLKRLRLRGDWSDTGPNARPESEAQSAESTLMQRMSDMFVRWIQESFRERQRSRRSRSETTSSSSMSPDSSMMYSGSSTSSESGGSVGAEGGGEDSGVRGVAAAVRGRHAARQHADEGTPRNSRTRERNGEPVPRNSPSEETMDTHSHDASRVGACAPPDKASRDEPMEVQADDVTSGTSSSTPRERKAARVRFREVDKGELGTVTDGADQEASVLERDESQVNDVDTMGVDTVGDKGRVQGVANTRDTGVGMGIAQGVPCIVVESRESVSDSSNLRTESDPMETQEGQETRDSKNIEQCPSDQSMGDRTLQQSSGDRITGQSMGDRTVQSLGDRTIGMQSHGEGHEGVRQTRSTGESTPSADIDMPQAGSEGPSREPTPSGDPSASEEPSYEPTEFERRLAAVRIQRLFRQRKQAKEDREVWEEEWDVQGLRQDRELWRPEMARVYRGHRNARTMIKEAAFWGNRHVVSGSDCGRIFLWDKDTCEIVMVLQADKHVVNCVQPHPFDPVLASSGIDYDVKLWSPTAESPHQMVGVDEIIKRNEKMLEENRDTITVPASFMLRMLASLNHARFARRNQDDSDTDTSDDE